MRRRGRSAGAGALAAGTWLAFLVQAQGCGPDGSAAPVGARVEAKDRALFTEITSEIGIPEPPPWPDGTYAVYEIGGAGVGFLDYDGDGDLDLYHPRFPVPGRLREPAPNRLYRQEEDGRFVDVSAASGLDDPGYGQAFAVGDVDEDGDLDVYLANYGLDAFYRNEGDGTFRNRTAEAGLVGEALWSSGAAFCDYDQDGDLDLYVAHYLDVDHTEPCLLAGNQPDYCGPRSFRGVPDTLYRNEGGGAFRDVTASAGLVADEPTEAKGLAVVCTDLTDDGRPDFFVANDGEPNHLWVNQGGGVFDEEAALRGVAVNIMGYPEGNMGIGVGDVNGDGHLDLFVTHLNQETNILYLGSGRGMFVDQTAAAGMGMHDMPFTGFGAGFFDYDLDGDLDVAVVNGRVRRLALAPGVLLSPFWSPYAEPSLLFENDGAGRFRNAGDRAGSFASTVELNRGLAFGDLDDDGDVDLAVAKVDQRLRVYRNDAPRQGRHFVRVRVLEGRRDSPGAQVTLRAGGRAQRRVATTGYSYQASNDPRVHFGLGPAAGIEEIEVLWPDGSRERFAADGVDRDVVLRKGEGERR